MVGVAVVGYGYWGPNLVRNFAQTLDARMVAVCDPRPERRAAAQAVHPTLRTYADMPSLLDDNEIDAVVIATPVHSHFALSQQALESGRHVLVEKPLTASVAEGEQLVELAAARGLTLMVDHTFIYTSAVRKVAELFRSGQLGRLLYYDSVRVNLGLFQSDVSVLWDLAVHDLSILDFIIGKTPVKVAATGVAHVEGQPQSLAYLTCIFEENLIAHFHVNWLAPVKIRQIILGGTDKMVVVDDLSPSEKVKVYEKGIMLSDTPENELQRHVGYRTGDMWAPRLDNVEALAAEARHFVECIQTGATPDSDGQAGLRVVRILERATESMQQDGRAVMV